MQGEDYSLSKNNSGGGTSLTGVLLVIFVILKLTGDLTWSWLWILSPLWIPLGLMALWFLFALAVGFVVRLSVNESAAKAPQSNSNNKSSRLLGK